MHAGDPLRGLTDEIVDDGSEVAGLLEHRELTVGARAFIENPKGILHLLPAAEVVENDIDEPFDGLADELPRGQFGGLAEVDELSVETEAHRAPLVLLDHRLRVDTERHVVAPQLPELGDDGLENGSDGD